MATDGAGWQWPQGMEAKPEPSTSQPAFDFHHPPQSSDSYSFKREDEGEEVRGDDSPEESTPEPPRTENSENARDHYPTRQCRICLEEVRPSFEPVAEGLSTFLKPKPKVEYISSDPESGRLIRPCKCRGSQKYVHEGCLQEWRHADPAYARRNYWECPTCKFQYRLERMRWSRAIQSTLVQLGLTAFIMVITVFLLGFVADPILNLYFEPAATISSIATGHGVGHLDFEDDIEDYDGWIVHFMKGLTSIGVIGLVKVLFTLNPISWWNIRQTGLVGGGRGRRERNEGNFSFIIIVGIIAFLFVSGNRPNFRMYDTNPT
jgi:hypothetical protein